MIRDFKKKDIDEVMQLWLESNINAHFFIDKSYWISQYDAVREAIVHADLAVYEENAKIIGFIGLMEDYIAGIFVQADKRSEGIGKSLIEYEKERHDRLVLNVFMENERAVRFYNREGFHVIDEMTDEDTDRMEYQMEWRK